jgi:conserved oligomeric Golgi complex subunit 1
METSISLQRWQQAFEDHPVSTTRAIEKQLRSSVANNRERLRGLVGGKYRELLSTVDQIIYLDGKTKSTESRISDIGRRCEPPGQGSRAVVSPETRLISELWLLQACLAATQRSLLTRDILRASRLLIISRVLLKSLQSGVNQPSSLTVLKDRISSLRRKCIARIDATLTNPRSKSRSLVSAACAYCLITSASASEVFQYTQRLRLEKLKTISSTGTASPRLAEEVLQYILTTLQVLRRAFGRPLVDGLNDLQRRPIIHDLDLIGTEVVPSYEVLSLVSEDASTFTPYFKREPIPASESNASLERWTSDACQIFTHVLQDRASRASDVSEVLAVRQNFLSLVLPCYFDSKAGNVLRQTVAAQVAARIAQLGELQVRELGRIAEMLTSPTTPPPGDLSLWNPKLAGMSLGSGSGEFLRQVHKRYHGHRKSLLTVSGSLDIWIASVAGSISASDRTKSIRWRDMLEEPSDEQEDEADRLITSLSRDEPEELINQTRGSLRRSLEQFTTTLASAVNETTKEEPDLDLTVYWLRAIRLVMQPLRRAFPEEAALKDLGDLIPRLHLKLATKIATQIARQYAPVDEGEHQAVVDELPSPAAFTLLQGLCDTMQEIGGSDIWSRPAIKSVKKALRHELFPTDSEEAIWKKFDSEFLACALRDGQASPPESTEAISAESYWQRTRLLFGILAE